MPHPQPDQWENPQRILVVLAHPDDPEFFCGATVARWAAAGHVVHYALLTCGDKGTSDRTITSEQLARIRGKEQRAAADVLGVKKVRFLEYPDGYLVPDLSLRRDITRLIREEKPDVLVTCDPTTLYARGTRLNHPDHRAAGQATLDAVFPAARDHLNFIELWRDEGLDTHIVREVWVAGTQRENITLDVTAFWETKIRAICQHKSQIKDPEKLAEWMRERRTEDSTPEEPHYQEKFLRLLLA